MLCAKCRSPIDDTSQFCPYCGESVAQTNNPSSSAIFDPKTYSFIGSGPQQGTPSTLPNDVLGMRASDGIWDFTEPEKDVVPGQRRPILVMDEEYVHLAHTDKILTPEELFERVKYLIDQHRVPVDVKIVKTCWMGDVKEVRSRIIASLKNHSYSDIKMILGLDYMGQWATIHLNVGHEPEPKPPAPPWSINPIIALLGALGILMFVIGGFSDSWTLKSVGLFAVVGAVVGTVFDYRGHKKKQEMEELASEKKRLEDRSARTFKFDDMRLFASAMRVVFQAVVDDIVQKGAEIVKVTGGHGGMLREETPKPVVSAPIVTDASQAEV